MKLVNAKLCVELDCNEIYSDEKQCPSCGAGNYISLAAIINRNTERKLKEEKQ